MQAKLEILLPYQWYIRVQVKQLLQPWSEKSKSLEQRSVYSKPGIQGVCRDQILKFDESPSNRWSGSLWNNISARLPACHPDAWSRRGWLNQAVGWYPKKGATTFQTAPSMGAHSLFQPMPKRYLPCSEVPIWQQWNIPTVTSTHTFNQNL